MGLFIKKSKQTDSIPWDELHISNIVAAVFHCIDILYSDSCDEVCDSAQQLIRLAALTRPWWGWLQL